MSRWRTSKSFDIEYECFHICKYQRQQKERNGQKKTRNIWYMKEKNSIQLLNGIFAENNLRKQ